MKETTIFKCPLCETVLTVLNGSKNSTTGVTVRCENATTCPAQEVEGYGKDVKAAYEIVLQKYAKGRN
jgi:transcription elongation factor Elf1